MTNAEIAGRAAAGISSFGLRRSLVISISSLVIHVLALAIRTYQLVISPAQTCLFGAAGGCRFTPSCSQYALAAVREHGPLPGGWLAAKRICRCHPWGGCGPDPVPQKEFVIRRSPSGH